MKKIILLLIIFIQLLTIGVILKNINKKSVLGTVSVNPIHKDTLITSKSGELKYFYEYKPNITIKPDPIFPGLENVSYHINNDGLNQIENYSRHKNYGIYRIVTIGDSFTFGKNVNTEDNYPSQLNQLLNLKLTCKSIKKFEVINLGVAGYDIKYTLERFKTKGDKYNPDITLWVVIDRDLRKINELLIPEMNKSESKDIKSINIEDMLITKLGGIDKVLSIQKKYMNSIDTSSFGKLIILSFPNSEKKYKKFFKNFANTRRNVFFVDNTLPDLNLHDALLPDQHPTKNGHSLIAKAILDYLITKQMVPCKYK